MNSGYPIHWTDHKTWLWIVYIWLLPLAVSKLKPLWRWAQRHRAKSWPITMGRVEAVSVNEPKRSFFSSTPRRSSAPFTAEIRYSYSVAGKPEAGLYQREFNTEAEAWEFLRDLNGKSVGVHCNPSKPSASALSEPSIGTLLQARAPNPDAENLRLAPASSISQWSSTSLWVFVFLSAVGLGVSLWVHIGTLEGRRVAPEALFWILHIGIFVVWIPAVLVAKQRVGNMRRKDFWKAVLHGAPGWMRYMVYGFLAYAIINFMLFFPQAPNGDSGANPPAIVWRGFSGHWMAFYSAALAILYSAIIDRKNAQRCVNGHLVPPNANFCDRCGQPVVHA